jgi:hypothetical protein
MLLPLRLPLPAPKNLPEGIAVGDQVGSGRIPYGHAHPDCWQTPWTGTLLAIDDVEAWAGSLAFPEAEPEQLEVSAHVRWCLGQGLLQNKVPVKWGFGKVMWERPETLRTVEADLAAFESAREAARR